MIIIFKILFYNLYVLIFLLNFVKKCVFFMIDVDKIGMFGKNTY